MFNVSIELDSRLLEARIGKFESLLKRKIIEAMAFRGSEAIRLMRMLAPILTGYLQSKLEISELDFENLIIEFHSGAPYAAFPEFGTVNQRAQPHFRPAFWIAYFAIVEDVALIIKELWG